MKKLLLSFIFSLQAQEVNAFQKKKLYHSLSIGGQNYVRFPSEYNGGNYFRPGTAFFYELEWACAEYFGINMHLGFNGRSNFQNNVNTYNELFVPIGFQGNFHFYKLIDANSDKDIRSDKVDIYAGIAVGAGPVIGAPQTIFTSNDLYGGFYAGPQLGIRYFPSKHFGIFQEMGFGKSLIQFGIVLR